MYVPVQVLYVDRICTRKLCQKHLHYEKKGAEISSMTVLLGAWSPFVFHFQMNSGRCVPLS